MEFIMLDTRHPPTLSFRPSSTLIYSDHAADFPEVWL